MQSNNYGFELAAHPCADGECDAQSMCDYKLRDYGNRQYGSDSWGPNGSIIDTTQWFYMKTEFVTQHTYSSMWKVRTQVWQDGREILMEADCEDYLHPLTYDLDGKMGLAISNWDNSDKRADFAFDDAPNPSPCEGAWLFSTLDVLTWGSNEEKEEEEVTPEPEPEVFQEFLGMIDWGDDSTVSMETTEFWVKGLDGGYL